MDATYLHDMTWDRFRDASQDEDRGSARQLLELLGMDIKHEGNGIMQLSVTTESADRELERRVVNFLAGRHVPGLRHLEVSAQGGTVTVSGRVRSFYEKQLCQECCKRVAGVIKLIDDVDVAYRSAAKVGTHRGVDVSSLEQGGLDLPRLELAEAI